MKAAQHGVLANTAQQLHQLIDHVPHLVAAHAVP